jgi:transposase
MPTPLSNDLRKRIIEAKGEGASHAKIAREMRVSISAITRLMALYRETGSHEARPMYAGRKPRLNEEILEKISRRIEEQPDIRWREFIAGFSLPVSAPALCKMINKKLGRCRKKTAHAAEQQRPDVAERRSEWKARQSVFDPARLVFLDESGVNTGMTRWYGRAAKHQRVIEAVPDTQFHRTTIASSIRLDGTTIPLVFEGHSMRNSFGPR